MPIITLTRGIQKFGSPCSMDLATTDLLYMARYAPE